MNTICDWKTEVLDPTLGCLTCDKCYEPNDVKNLCAPVADFATCKDPDAKPDPTVCDWSSEVINPLGVCEPCGKCTAPDWTSKYCLPVSDYTTCMTPAPTADPGCPTG